MPWCDASNSESSSMNCKFFGKGSRSCEVDVDGWWTPDVLFFVAVSSSSQCRKCCYHVGVSCMFGTSWW